MGLVLRLDYVLCRRIGMLDYEILVLLCRMENDICYLSTWFLCGRLPNVGEF